MTLIVATWMYSVPTGDSALHPQVGRRSDTRSAKEIYWRCAFCLFASSSVHNSGARHVLLVNERPPDQIDGIATADLCTRYRIELIDLPTITRPPTDYHGAWNTQFIVLDALDALNGLAGEDDTVLLLDGDCVFVRPFTQANVEQVRELGALTYELDYSPNQVVNGLSGAKLNQLSHEYEPAATRGVKYCGGEWICTSGRLLPKLAQRARMAFETSVSRHLAGEAKFCEEAQLLSYVYATLDVPSRTAQHLVKRIWTDRGTYCNVNGLEAGLTLWHLPAEKKAGFVKLFRTLSLPEESASLMCDVDRLSRLFRLRVSAPHRMKLAARRVVRRAYVSLRDRLVR